MVSKEEKTINDIVKKIDKSISDPFAKINHIWFSYLKILEKDKVLKVDKIELDGNTLKLDKSNRKTSKSFGEDVVKSYDKVNNLIRGVMFTLSDFEKAVDPVLKEITDPKKKKDFVDALKVVFTTLINKTNSHWLNKEKDEVKKATFNFNLVSANNLPDDQMQNVLQKIEDLSVMNAKFGNYATTILNNYLQNAQILADKNSALATQAKNIIDNINNNLEAIKNTPEVPKNRYVDLYNDLESFERLASSGLNTYNILELFEAIRYLPSYMNALSLFETSPQVKTLSNNITQKAITLYGKIPQDEQLNKFEKLKGFSIRTLIQDLKSINDSLQEEIEGTEHVKYVDVKIFLYKNNSAWKKNDLTKAIPLGKGRLPPDATRSMTYNNDLIRSINKKIRENKWKVKDLIIGFEATTDQGISNQTSYSFSSDEEVKAFKEYFEAMNQTNDTYAGSIEALKDAQNKLVGSTLYWADAKELEELCRKLVLQHDNVIKTMYKNNWIQLFGLILAKVKLNEEKEYNKFFAKHEPAELKEAAEAVDLDPRGPNAAMPVNDILKELEKILESVRNE